MGLIGFILFVTVTLMGCSNNNPTQLNRQNTELAEVIVETVDLYLDEEIDLEYAFEIINEAFRQIGVDFDDSNEEAVILLSSAIMSVHLEFLGDYYGLNSLDYDEVLESRNQIAELSGLDLRD